MTVTCIFANTQIFDGAINDDDSNYTRFWCGISGNNNLSINQKMFKMLHQNYHDESITVIEHPFENTYFKSLSLLYDLTHALKNIRNNWMTVKTKTLSFKDPDSGVIINAKWSDFKAIYKEEQNNPIKRTKLDYRTLFPNNYEKQKVGLVLYIFNERTAAVLKQKQFHDTALFLNVKSPNDGIQLNDTDRYPFNDTNDECLDFLHRMATLLKEMDNSLKGQRVCGLTQSP